MTAKEHIIKVYSHYSLVVNWALGATDKVNYFDHKDGCGMCTQNLS